jgi:hypothetical protein
MKSLDNEKRLMMFRSAEKTIRNKLVLVNDSNERKRIEQAGDFFDETINGIRSVIKRETKYVLVDNLRKMLEFAGYSFKDFASQQEKELGKAIADFGQYRNWFRELEDNPKRFYSEEYRTLELENICDRMKNFYQRLVDEEDFRENSDD